jgi:hypothetical protein
MHAFRSHSRSHSRCSLIRLVRFARPDRGMRGLLLAAVTSGALLLAGCAAANVQTTAAQEPRATPMEPAAGAAAAAIADDTFIVAPLRRVRDDLHGLRAIDRATGAVFRVYHDSVSSATARAAAVELRRVYQHVAGLMGVDAVRVDWSAVAFVADPDYTPPRTDREVRWHLETDSTGRLTEESARLLVHIMAHEQAHAVHMTFADEVPRWFSEGVAMWVELRTTESLWPELAAELRAKYEASAAASPVNLRGWGGTSVRPEAILRQVSPEQRERMERDPTYMPPGPFRFQPDDFLTDTKNEKARYAAALALFEMVEREAGVTRLRSWRLEREDGTARLQAWLRAVWERGGAWSTPELVALAAALTGLDLGPYLR